MSPTWGAWRSVLTIHDLAFLRFPETHTPPSRGYYARSRESAARADRVIAVSQSTARDVVELFGIPPSKVQVVHEAASPAMYPRDASEFQRLAQRLGIDPLVPIVLFVGTLEPRKNVPLLLEAFARLRGSVRAQLLLVGARGWLDDSIFDVHRRLNLEDNAHFLGPLPEDDLAVLYSHASVLALPSLYEGFGLTPLEAMACGAPVLVSNAGPLPEVVGDAGILLSPEEPSAWADVLTRVLADQSFASDLRSRGLSRAAEFSWDRAAHETVAVYREVLGLS